jgi:hypothetical protein
MNSITRIKINTVQFLNLNFFLSGINQNFVTFKLNIVGNFEDFDYMECIGKIFLHLSKVPTVLPRKQLN